jgi:hypothetical protein
MLTLAVVAPSCRGNVEEVFALGADSDDEET